MAFRLSALRRVPADSEEAADGILIGTVEGTITDANRSMCELTGYSQNELLGNTIEMLFEPTELATNARKHGFRDLSDPRFSVQQ